MKGARADMAVGLFAVAVIAVLALMTFKVGGFMFGGKSGYRLYVIFNNTGGLDEKSRIKIAGVDAGMVEKISLDDGRAKLTLRINKDIKIYSDASAYIRSSGLLGDKYLEINVGSRLPLLKDGDYIPAAHEMADIDDLVRNLTSASANLMGLISDLNQPQLKENLRETIENMKYITEDLRGTLSSNKGGISSVISKIDHLATTLDSLATENRYALTNTINNFDAFSANLKAETPELIKQLSEASIALKTVMNKAEPIVANTSTGISTFFGTANDIANKVDSGQGTIGKLINDTKLYNSITNTVDSLQYMLTSVNRFHTFVRMDGLYLSKLKDSQGNFYVTLQPVPDKYYVLGVSSDPLGISTTTIRRKDGVVSRVKKTTSDVTFTAQFAKRYDNTALRLGLKQNSFGAWR